MKIIFKTLIFFFIAITFSSCNDEPAGSNNIIVNPPEENFKYPYAINSFWLYTTRNFLTNLRGDSIENYFNTDTIDGVGTAKFVKDTIIGNDTLRMLNNSHSEAGHSHTTIELYTQTDSGLLRKASYSEGTYFGPYRSNNYPLKYLFNRKIFNSINEIFKFYKVDFAEDSFNDSLIFDNPPVIAVKYPVLKNTEWFFDIASIWDITKKYIDFETVNLANGSYYCIKMQRLYYPNSSSIPEPNLIYHDYFSKEGMIKRDFWIKDVVVINQWNDTLGILDVKNEAYLNLYTP